jgi:hypothetical protein
MPTSKAKTTKSSPKITDFKELNLLKTLSKKEDLERFLPLIKKHTVVPEAWAILEDYKKYFSQYPERDEIDFSTFSAWFTGAHESWKEEKMTLYLKIIDNVSKADEDQCNELLQHYSRLDAAVRVRDAAEKYINGSVPDLSKAVTEILDEHSKSEQSFSETVDEGSLFIPPTAEHLVASLMTKGSGFKWSLKLLNQSLGPMHLGDFGAIMARPNAGKTTLAIQEILNWLLQMEDGSKAIIFNNEEKGEKLTAYAYKNLLKQPLSRIAVNPGKATKDFQDKLGDRRFYVDDRSKTTWAIQRVLDKVKPKIVVFNLLAKVKGAGSKDDSELVTLTKLYRWGREIGKDYECISLALHQADTSAEGEKFMNQQQMFGSKTEVQGELDVLFSIGKTLDVSSINNRWLTSCKNKQPDSPGMDPLLREGPLGEVAFEGDTATFKDK